ncbi:MAG TPA: hypothetical protein VN643_08530 [Pyrinomonadaceae bacterium]|nr:hypothetical protein [Pyrinomonadaceae bacterium]
MTKIRNDVKVKMRIGINPKELLDTIKNQRRDDGYDPKYRITFRET